MRKVIFDVDGVLFSEERYFDVSGLVIWEWLFSKAYMAIPGEREIFDYARITEGQIASIRNTIWGDNKLLYWLKAKGLNSNWDMVHVNLITIFWLMGEIYKARSGGELLSLSFDSIQDVKEAGLAVMGLPLPNAENILERWKKVVPEETKGHDVIEVLGRAISPCFSGNTDWLKISSNFYRLHTELFQSWYLGDDLFISKFHRLPISGNKRGLLERERTLVPAEEIKNMFRELKMRGYEIGVATGRSRDELLIPFNRLGWTEEFDPVYLATGNDALAAAVNFGGFFDKPHPFIFLCSIYGRKKENYGDYAFGRIRVEENDEVYVCGDSFADVLGGKSAGAVVIGVKPGFGGDEAEALFKRENVRCIDRITEILDFIR